jgi:hypothetical protein
VVAVAFDRGIRHEIIQVSVVRELSGAVSCDVVVDELTEKGERVALGEAPKTELADLNLECLGLVIEGPDGFIQLDFL